MERVFDGKYHWNEESYSWERADKEQWYKGWRIVSVSSKDSDNKSHHRFYELTDTNGAVGQIGINKRGGNIGEIKNMIDFFGVEQ